MGDVCVMNGTEHLLQNDCDFSGIEPSILPLPYPPIQVREENQFYANLLTLDLCSSVSELTAILQYIHGESCLCSHQCALAKTILGIAMAEMIHLQKLGEMIILLGGHIDFSYKTRTGMQMWLPSYINLASNERQIISANIEAERAAIIQYRDHMSRIEDDCVNALLERIIEDEEYHIMLLQRIGNF